MAPIDRKWAQALLASTSIQKKYLEQGHADYITEIVDAGICLSDLAVNFSGYFPAATRFIITEFEINPFVFTPHGEFIALDGFARFRPRKVPVEKLTVAPKSTVRPFFEPVGVAVIGVSTSDNAKMGKHHRGEPDPHETVRRTSRQSQGWNGFHGRPVHAGSIDPWPISRTPWNWSSSRFRPKPPCRWWKHARARRSRRSSSFPEGSVS